jgi:hypothetical protein
MQNKTETVSEVLNRLGIGYQSIDRDGVLYCITTGTGEREYGDGLGGSAAFAYEADDETNVDEIDSYSDFCQVFSPCENRGLGAQVAMDLGLRLTEAGSCDPVISDEEFLLCRSPKSSIELVQGQDERGRDFGYVCGDEGGFFFTWMPTLAETVASVDEDSQDGDGCLTESVVKAALEAYLPETSKGRQMWGDE